MIALDVCISAHSVVGSQVLCHILMSGNNMTYITINRMTSGLLACVEANIDRFSDRAGRG